MLVSEGQANAEGRALVELALDGDGSAMHLDEFLHERKADSAAFVAAAAGSFDAAEALKQMGSSCSGTPVPVSRTVSSAPVSSLEIETRISPSNVAFRALERRLSTTFSHISRST